MFIKTRPKYRVFDKVFNKRIAFNENGYLQPFSELSVSCIISDKRESEMPTRYSYLCVSDNQVFTLEEDKLMSRAELFRTQRTARSIADSCIFLAKLTGILLGISVFAYISCISFVAI